MPAINLKINQLLLDKENPRYGDAANQRAALQEVLDDQENKLYVLAKSISDKGMSPMDRLLVMKEKPDSKKFIPLEGNRRAAALKILTDPKVLSNLELKNSLKVKLEKLAKNFNHKKHEPIACFEMPDRESAAEWVRLRHTGENRGEGVARWKGVAAARFRGSNPALQALEFVRHYGHLVDEQKELLGAAFPITTLSRLLETPSVRQLLGVTIDNKKLKTRLPAQEIIKPLRRIVVDLAEGVINVDDVKTKQQQINYIKKLESSDKPDLLKQVNERTIEEIKGDEFKKPLLPPKSKGRQPYDPSKRTTIINTRGRKLNIQSSRIAAIFNELKGLKAELHRNAGSVLLRVFLELSVDYYMDNNPGLSKTFKHPKSGGVHNKELDAKIQEVVDHLIKKGHNKKDFNSIQRALHDKRSPLSIRLLHDYVHNLFTIPKPQDLKDAWDEAQPFFEKIWS